MCARQLETLLAVSQHMLPSAAAVSISPDMSQQLLTDVSGRLVRGGDEDELACLKLLLHLLAQFVCVCQ